MKIGVLALQGDFAAHAEMLAQSGAHPVELRSSEHFGAIDGLVIPGGESTTISKLLASSGLAEPLEAALAEGMPALGTCAGMIVLAAEVADGRADQVSFSAIDISVRRNAFGRQSESFEADVDLGGGRPLRAVFIRAPAVERAGPAVEVIACMPGGPREGEPILCRQGTVMACSFHPEIAGDPRVHEMFLRRCVR